MNKRFNYFPVSIQELFDSIDTTGWNNWFETELYNKKNKDWFNRSFVGTEKLNRYAIINSEGDGEYTLNIPGYGPEDIDVYFKNDKLFIVSKCDCDDCNCKSFKISYNVNKNVDKDKTEVTVKNGVLTLKVYKIEEQEDIKKIEVK